MYYDVLNGFCFMVGCDGGIEGVGGGDPDAVQLWSFFQ